MTRLPNAAVARLHVYTERRTYTALGRLLLSLPLGIVTFTVVAIALVLSAVAAVVAPIVVSAMLLQERADPGADPSRSVSRRLREVVSRNRRLPRELGYLLLRLPLGILDFTIAVLVLSVALGGFAGLVVIPAGGYVEVGPWRVDRLGEALVLVPASLPFLFVAGDAIRGWASVSERIATAVRGSRSSEPAALFPVRDPA